MWWKWNQSGLIWLFICMCVTPWNVFWIQSKLIVLILSSVIEAHSHECDHYEGSVGRNRPSPAERLEMVADRGSTLHPAAAERHNEDEEKLKSTLSRLSELKETYTPY